MGTKVGEKGGPLRGSRLPSESVIVDIGGTVGALVVHAAPALDGAEIEICPVGTSARSHTIVRPREVPGGTVVYAGVFPSLAAGDYQLLAWGEQPEATLHIAGGAVTELFW